MNMNTLTFIATMAAMVGLSQPAPPDDAWMFDIPTALSRAETEGKDLLLLYTGSDWCPPCKKLDEEVFSHPEFATEAGKSFVLVILDFPKNKPLGPDVVEQNQQWAHRFGVTGYPTVILMDRAQRPYGITGYREGGLENYLGLLADFFQRRIRRDEAFAKAETLQGASRAEMLDAALSELDKNLVELYYRPVVDEIVSIDNEDDLGLRTKWNAERDSEMRKIVMTDIAVLSRLHTPQMAVKFIDEVLAEIAFPPNQLLQIQQIKLGLLRKQNDLPGMDQLLDQMIAMPELTQQTVQRLIVKKVLLMLGTGRNDLGWQTLEAAIGAARPGESGGLWLAKGQILASQGRWQEALTCFNSGIQAATHDPDQLIELYGAKADAHLAGQDELKALQTLDEFERNPAMPVELRVDALLQKAMILRDTGRHRRAALVENRAIEISENPQQRAETQKLVERIRKKSGN